MVQNTSNQAIPTLKEYTDFLEAFSLQSNYFEALDALQSSEANALKNQFNKVFSCLLTENGREKIVSSIKLAKKFESYELLFNNAC